MCPFKTLHLVPYVWMFLPHVISNRVGMWEETTARRDGARGGITRIMSVYVAPNSVQIWKWRGAQWTNVPRHFVIICNPTSLPVSEKKKKKKYYHIWEFVINFQNLSWYEYLLITLYALWKEKIMNAGVGNNIFYFHWILELFLFS